MALLSAAAGVVMNNNFTGLWFPTLVTILIVAFGTACKQEKRHSFVSDWKFALEEIHGSVQDAYAQKFKELIEQRTNNEISVTVYPYGTLGTSDQVTELIHMGAIQFATASPGHLGKTIPELQLFLLHFVFSNDNVVNQAVLGESQVLRDYIDQLYQHKGLKFLALYPEGWQVWTTNKEIRQPQDFAGLKMRVMTSPMLLRAYAAYGANPTPLPYSEVYSALQLHMIDAQVNPVFAIEEMSFYEVTDYLIFPRHAQFVTSVVTNPHFFETLPTDKQQLIKEVITELNSYIFTVQETFNSERLKTMQTRKPNLQIRYLTAAERDAFRKASLPVRQEYIDMVGPRGKALLTILLEEVVKAEQELGSSPNTD